MIAAAAVVLIGATIAALITLRGIRTPEVEKLLAATSANTIWSINGEVQEPGSNQTPVKAGDRVHVASGTLELKFSSGAAMVMQGPAKATFPNLNKPLLKEGWLWIDSGYTGQSFEVGTPDFFVRNTGTRFGVLVPKKGPAAVHLISGELEILARSDLDHPNRSTGI